MSEPVNPTPETIELMIKKELPGVRAAVRSLRDDGVLYFEAYVETPEFEGLSLLDRHRRIYAALMRGGFDPEVFPISLIAAAGR